MTNLDTEHSLSPDNTYVPVVSPQPDTFSRQLFLISVGSAAVPVLVAAVIMLENGHGLISKAAPSLSAHQASAHSLVARADTAPQPVAAVLSTAPVAASTDGASQISSERFSGMADVASSLHSVQAKSDLFQQSDMLRLALIQIPQTSSVHAADADAVESHDVESFAAAPSASQTKKIRVVGKSRPLARHHYRSQKHQQPNLLAKIGASVKKGLTQIANFPKQAMEGRLGE